MAAEHGEDEEIEQLSTTLKDINATLTDENVFATPEKQSTTFFRELLDRQNESHRRIKSIQAHVQKKQLKNGMLLAEEFDQDFSSSRNVQLRKMVTDDKDSADDDDDQLRMSFEKLRSGSLISLPLSIGSYNDFPLDSCQEDELSDHVSLNSGVLSINYSNSESSEHLPLDVNPSEFAKPSKSERQSENENSLYLNSDNNTDARTNNQQISSEYINSLMSASHPSSIFNSDNIAIKENPKGVSLGDESRTSYNCNNSQLSDTESSVASAIFDDYRVEQIYHVTSNGRRDWLDELDIYLDLIHLSAKEKFITERVEETGNGTIEKIENLFGNITFNNLPQYILKTFQSNLELEKASVERDFKSTYGAQLTEANNEVDALNDNLQALQTENNTLKNELRNLNTELSKSNRMRESNASWENRYLNSESLLKSAEKENESLKKALNDLETKLCHVENEKNTITNEHFFAKTENNKLNLDNESLKRLLANDKTAFMKENRQLNDELFRLNEENTLLKENESKIISSKQTDTEIIRLLEEKYKKLQVEIESKTISQKETKERQELAENEANKYKNDVSNVLRMLAEKEGQLSRLQKEYNALAKEYSQHKNLSRLAELKSSEELDRLKSSFRDLKTENWQLNELRKKLLVPEHSSGALEDSSFKKTFVEYDDENRESFSKHFLNGSGIPKPIPTDEKPARMVQSINDIGNGLSEHGLIYDNEESHESTLQTFHQRNENPSNINKPYENKFLVNSVSNNTKTVDDIENLPGSSFMVENNDHFNHSLSSPKKSNNIFDSHEPSNKSLSASVREKLFELEAIGSQLKHISSRPVKPENHKANRSVNDVFRSRNSPLKILNDESKIHEKNDYFLNSISTFPSEFNRHRLSDNEEINNRFDTEKDNLQVEYSPECDVDITTYMCQQSSPIGQSQRNSHKIYSFDDNVSPHHGSTYQEIVDNISSTNNEETNGRFSPGYRYYNSAYPVQTDVISHDTSKHDVNKYNATKYVAEDTRQFLSMMNEKLESTARALHFD